MCHLQLPGPRTRLPRSSNPSRENGNPHVRSDAALGALLAEAALRGALLNVRGNAAMLEDRDLAAAYLTDADLLEKAGREAAQRAYRTAIGRGCRGRVSLTLRGQNAIFKGSRRIRLVA